MTRLFVLALWALVGATQAAGQPAADYAKLYGGDYDKAKAFVQENKTAINTAAAKYSIDAQLLTAIVFPELIRYNAFRDFFEAGALEYAYVYGGTTAADFSIGYFQIKPSFVEQLEKLVKQQAQAAWAKDFVKDFGYTAVEMRTPALERQRRHERLQSAEWQIRYAACFYKYVEFKFKDYLQGKSKRERLRFMATAYNAGFGHSAETIVKKQKMRFFPHGIGYPQAEQHCYADISIYAYEKTIPTLLSP